MSRATCRCSTPPRSASRWRRSAEPDADIATLAAEIADPAALAETSVNKVAAGFADPSRPARALYFSKAPVPWGDGPHYEHVGLYAYRRAALDRFVTLPRGVLEQRERLEQLRALEAGMRICGQPDRHGAARRAGRYPGRSRPRRAQLMEQRKQCRMANQRTRSTDDRLSGRARRLFRPRVPPGLSGHDDSALRRVRGRLCGGARRRGARWR